VGQAEGIVEQGFSLEERAALQGQTSANQPPLTPREAGQYLFESFFSSPIEKCYRRSLDKLGPDEGLRINLRLDLTPELADLPWEALYDPGTRSYLALSRHTPLVRYMQLEQAEAHLPVAPPLRVLVLIANPRDRQPALDVKAEWERIQTALRPLRDTGQVILEQLAGATIDALHDRLRKDDVHVLHYIGHADFDPQKKTGHLILEDQNRKSRPVSAEQLQVVLQDQRQLRLAFLNACEGAQSDDEDSYAGIAQGLVFAGVPVVIGMRQKVGDGVAASLAGEFYEAVSDGYPIDAALAEARKAIFLEGDDLSWGLPVLFSRSADNSLIEIPSPLVPLPPIPSPFNPLLRRLALPVLALVLLITLGIAAFLPADSRFGWIQVNIEQRDCRNQIDGTCIVVARLAPSNSDTSNKVTQLLSSSMVAARKDYNYKIVYTRPAQNRQEALALARRYAAPLIVWGDVFDSPDPGAIVHLEVVDRLGIAQGADLEPFRLQHFPVDSASVTADFKCGSESNCWDPESGRLVNSAPIVARLAIGLSAYSLRDVKAVITEMGPLADCIVTPGGSDCAVQYLLPYLDKQTQSLILYYVGQVYGMQLDYKQALVYLTKARELAPEDPALAIAAGRLYKEWAGSIVPKETDKAFGEAQKLLGYECLANDKKDAGERLYSLGVIYELQEKWSDAEKCYAMAVEALKAQESDPYSALINLARVQRSAGRKEVALETLSQAEKLAPNLPWTELELAELSRENEAEARLHLDKAATLAPSMLQIEIARAGLCTIWGDIECAKNAYAIARSSRPDYAWIAVKIGEFYQKQEEWTQAQTHIEAAIDLGSQSPWAYESLGFVSLRQEQWQEAADAYRQSIRLAYSDESVRHLFCPESKLLEFFQRDELELLQKCAEWATDDDQRVWAEQRIQELTDVQNEVKG